MLRIYMLAYTAIFLTVVTNNPTTAGDFFPLAEGTRFEYTRSDHSGNSWQMIWDTLGKATFDLQQYTHNQVHNYNNDDAVFDIYVRSTTTEIYDFIAGSGENLAMQMAPIGTQWIVSEPDSDEYQWKVIEIVETHETGGSITVPYGTFNEYYTRRAFQCVDPNNLSLGVSPYWYETFVPGVGRIKEVDYWNDSPPMTTELTNIIMIPEYAQLKALGNFNFDDTVGLLDLDILGREWNRTDCSFPTNRCDADANDDGEVGLLDLDILGRGWGTIITTPEPATFGIFAMTALLVTRRR